MKNLLSIIISGLLLFLTLGVNTAFAQCGPGPHWIDNCSAGVDIMQSHAVVKLNFDPTSCAIPNNSFTLNGPVRVLREASQDIAVSGCCSATVDGHKDVIPTEIDSMYLTDGVYTLVAGHTADPMLQRSLGDIVEDPSDSTLACSFFNVFFKIITPLGTLYNQTPVRLRATIDRVPPNTVQPNTVEYTICDPLDYCIALFTSPTLGKGTRIANLVSEVHILPVKLTSFTYSIQDNQRILLTWEVTQQENIRNYIVERSSDGVSYSAIGSISANNLNSFLYRFADNDPAEGLNFYRLRIAEDDRSSYSRTLAINFSAKDDRIVVYPVPASVEVTIFVKDNTLINKEVQLLSLDGRVLQNIKLHSPRQKIYIGNLPRGIYYLKTERGNIYKVIK